MSKFSERYIPPIIVNDGASFKDERGWFSPLSALDGTCQVNVSVSKPGTVRGMHWQIKHPQPKLVSCLTGRIHDVCVDMRKFSPTFKKIFEFELNCGTGEQLYVPAGFAHGFEVIGDKPAMMLYLINVEYDADDECGFLWNSIDAHWQTKPADAIVSKKDGKMMKFEEIFKSDENILKLPEWTA